MDEVAIPLVDIPTCHVFKIPPRQSAAGYKAEDWNNCHIWTGKCTVLAKGNTCEVRLQDANTGELFASCPMTANDTTSAVESVTDSSRYFVLRVQDGSGRHAFIGIGFEERSHAFDFNVAITDFKNQTIKVQQSSQGQQLIEASNTDYSLKAGETIKVNLAGKNKITDPKKASGFNQALQQAGMSVSSSATGLAPPAAGLAPPTGGGKKAAFKAKQSSGGPAHPVAQPVVSPQYTSPVAVAQPPVQQQPQAQPQAKPVDDILDFLN